MNAVSAPTNPPVKAASAPPSTTSTSTLNTQLNKQAEEVVVQNLKSPTLAFTNFCEYVSHTKCLQPSEPIPSNLGTAMLPSIVSAVLVVSGWFVVNKAQSNRERRKQIREFVADLCDDLAELEILAIEYHTTPRHEPKEQEIISKLGRLEKGCATLPRFLKNQIFKAVSPSKLKMDGKRMQVLRKAMTLNHFGDEHTGSLGRQDEYILGLELAAEEMREELERVRIDALD